MAPLVVTAFRCRPVVLATACLRIERCVRAKPVTACPPPTCRQPAACRCRAGSGPREITVRDALCTFGALDTPRCTGFGRSAAGLPKPAPGVSRRFLVTVTTANRTLPGAGRPSLADCPFPDMTARQHTPGLPGAVVTTGLLSLLSRKEGTSHERPAGKIWCRGTRAFVSRPRRAERAARRRCRGQSTERRRRRPGTRQLRQDHVSSFDDGAEGRLGIARRQAHIHGQDH